MGLTLKQRKFVKEYCVDENATQAAIRAGYSENGAGQQAHLLLKNIEILSEIEERREQLAAMAEIDEAWVVKQWKQIATADANELTQVRKVNCRHCNGYDHNYQWTEAEYMSAVNVAADTGRDAPDGMGGFGFDVNADPHPLCPECGGLGIENIFIADTRKLKGSAKLLYAGVKKTRDGLQILTRDQDAALANISRYLGMTLERKEISGPGGGPVPLAHISAKDLTDDQLAAILLSDADET